MSKKYIIAKSLASLALLGALGSSAFANPTSTAKTKVVPPPSLIDSLTLAYAAQYFGPSITNPTYATSDATNDGNLTDTQNLDNTFLGGYKLTPHSEILGNFRFVLETYTKNQVQDLKIRDPWISYRDRKFYSNGPFNVNLDVRLIFPVAPNSRGNLNTGIRSTQIATYSVPSTRLTLGTFTFVRANVLRGDVTGLPNASFNFSSFANYQMLPTVGATLWSDIVQIDYWFGNDIENYAIPVSPGVNWDVTPNFSLNPMLTFYPFANEPSWEKTTIGLFISARIL